MRPVRVLIVDDSLTMRRLIRLALSADPRIVVVGEARDAAHARQRMAELDPDVLTLDVEMPGMSGLDFLRRLMATRPMPVIMVSTETHGGSAAAIEALALGAVDCVGKPAGTASATAFAALPDLVVAASTARISPLGRRTAGIRPAPPQGGFVWNGRFVLIGSSTGGVEALERILAEYPANCPPTVIVQHMPAGFLASLAGRLNARVAPTVQLAASGAPLVPGHVHIAPGGDTHLTIDARLAPVCRLVQSDRRGGHRPSADVLFESALPLGGNAVAVLLTGMGRDGAQGMLAMRRAGSVCLAQDQQSCVVFGMPRVAQELGAVDRMVALHDMAREILAASGRGVGALAGRGGRA
ncbi:protein-glutamate methylesterase/protein-glutamine glutaminase [Paracoccus luteus]|uniref:protein-glutamate methylesterase/protein-glutamine glutaminase n=1 Tax=Paracoccus luteus TaxID=2508543 RepID=UPI0010702245|nr:chemotaxis response regulator protein-glutamate methylesterase [Paracoccus luteus]